MIRGIEFLLFALPFVLFAAWWILGATATRRIVWFACVALALLAGALFWYILTHRIGIHEVYVPAHLENGVIVPGQGEAP